MAIVKKRNEDILNGLLLESSDPVVLPPAEVGENSVTVQFEKFTEFVPELLEVLRNGAIAETVPVIKDASTFAIHGRTKTFWVKLWHRADSELTVIERLQVLNVLPLMRGIRVTLNKQD